TKDRPPAGLRDGSEVLARLRVPHVHAAVVARPGQFTPVRAKRQRGNGRAVLGEGVHRPAPAVGVPEVDASLPVPGRQPPPVAAERYANRDPSVASEPVLEPVVLPVPEVYSPLVSGHEVSAIAGAECHGVRRPRRANGVTLAAEYLRRWVGRQV